MRRPLGSYRRILALALAAASAPLVGGCGEHAEKTTASFAKSTAAPAARSGEVLSADSYDDDGSPPTPTKSDAPAPAPAAPIAPANPAGETYAKLVENGYRDPAKQPLSTFSVDVDTASYANVRRFLTQGMLPPKDAVRVEELINYFPYAYPQPTKADEPFSVNVEVSRCPWEDGHRLAKIGLKGREVASDKRPASNLVFLLDVSGSMQVPNKLPLVKAGLRLLVDHLGENDRVAIVVYAGSTGLALPSTSCAEKAKILGALDALHASGSTNGAAGLRLAYETAVGNFIAGGTNRVILCTDGDFNVGVSDPGELGRLIEAKAKSGVFLSVLGFGMGNYQDKTIERLADKGNGNAAYIDTLREANKVLVEQMGGTLLTIAKDVKVQVEFNPAKVASYRLIGYEDRLLQAKDFNDDKKDAGEIGAGHSVTALYEIVPAGREAHAPGVDPLRYAKPAAAAEGKADEPAGRELCTVKLRFKPPEGDQSQLIAFAVEDDGTDDHPTDDFRFAAAVAEFGLLLRDSPFNGQATWDAVLERAESSHGPDPSGYRREFLDLVRKARTLAGK